MNPLPSNTGANAPHSTGVNVQALPIGADLSVATLNCNGLLTEVGEGSREVSRLEIILKYFKAANVQIFAIQEPHLRTESDTLEQQMKKVNTLAKRAGYELMTQLTVGGMRGGGGGVAIFWNKEWTCVSAMSFSPRIMVVQLRNADGLEISVVGAHFHHEPSKRLAQYELLRKQSNYINLGRHCVLLADHNFAMAPGVDSEVCTVHDGLPDAVGARDAERAFCVSHDLCDAWSHAFKHTEDPDADHTPKGWTWGFHTEHRADPKPGSEDAPLPFAPHRRRIDRIHFASHMLHSLTRCYTHRLGGSDHRAVIATLSPPHSTDTQQRLRVPVSFLKDPETGKEMEAELKAVGHQGDGWWEEATRIIKKTAFRFEKSNLPCKAPCISRNMRLQQHKMSLQPLPTTTLAIVINWVQRMGQVLTHREKLL